MCFVNEIGFDNRFIKKLEVGSATALGRKTLSSPSKDEGHEERTLAMAAHLHWQHTCTGTTLALAASARECQGVPEKGASNPPASCKLF